VNNRVKAPWCIDLLNLNLNNPDLGPARERIEAYFIALERDGTRLTENPDL
jgi:malate synthase